jgi:hypothetical protein
MTIQATPIDRSTAWTLSDATAEEEESSDGDDNVIVGERCWTVSRLTLRGQSSTLRLDRGLSSSPIRSTVLRC